MSHRAIFSVAPLIQVSVPAAEPIGRQRMAGVVQL